VSSLRHDLFFRQGYPESDVLVCPAQSGTSLFLLPLPAMGQKKLIRFAELNTFPNVLQYPEGLKGKWNGFFKNNNPITLELACGKGEYAVGLGQLYPHKNFIGVDQKGNRLWVGAKKALQQQLSNVAFLRIQIDQVNEYFEANEVSEIWITFPDPQLRTGKSKKRLTHPKFLRLYKQILVPGGFIHLKTDSPDLYRFTKLVIRRYNCDLVEDIDDVYKDIATRDDLKIKTYYESLDIAGSNRIQYLKFSLPAVLPDKTKDKELQELLKEYEAK
jgi:tRNA (guanine-N7-)-methyltransferase